MKIKNKKGFAGDYILVVILLFVLAMMFLVLNFTWNVVNDGWQSADIGSTSKSILGDFVDKFPKVWDWVYTFWLIGFILIMVVLAISLRTHPVFIGLAFISITIITGMISVYFANAYNDLAINPVFVSSATSFDKMTFIQQKFPFIVIILSAIVIIALFAKKNSGSDLGI